MIFKTGSAGVYVYQIDGVDEDNVTLQIFDRFSCVYNKQNITLDEAFVKIDKFILKEHNK